MTLNKRNKQRSTMLLALMALILFCVGLHIFNAKESHKKAQTSSSTLPPSHIQTIYNNSVFTPDWGIAATMTSLGYPPFAVGDKRGYAFRVKTPSLPKEVIDAGYRGQPNPELLAELELDVIINSINYKEATDAYPKDIPVVFTDFGNRNLQIGKVPEWERFTPYIHDIASAINQPEIADPYIKKSHQRIIEAGENIRKRLGDDRKLLVSDFWDMRQMSVYNTNSSVSTTVQMMGLELVSIGEPTKWGSSYIYPDKLYDLPEDTCLILMEPIVGFTKYDNVTSPIWQRSPFFQPDACLYVLDPVWTNNGIESMVTFANNLEAAVTNPVVNDMSYEAFYQQDVNKHDE